MKLPEVRVAMFTLAARLRVIEHPDLAAELEALAEETRRRSPVRRASPSARPISMHDSARILAYSNRHPQMSLREIGAHFDVDQGRVSEIIAGHRS